MPWTSAPCAVPTNQIWIETEHAIALPDAFPVVDGHMLMVPPQARLQHQPVAAFRANGDLGTGEGSAPASLDWPETGWLQRRPDGVGAGQSVQHAHVHALLRALADISVEKGDDSGASLTIPTHAISEKFVADSWRQSVPYAAGSSTRVLKPNTGDQAIV